MFNLLNWKPSEGDLLKSKRNQKSNEQFVATATTDGAEVGFQINSSILIGYRLRVVQTKAILNMKSMSEISGSDIKRL